MAKQAASGGVLSGTPAALRGKLAKLGITRDADLLTHLPLRYLDETRLTPIAELEDGMLAVAEGEVTLCQLQFKPRKMLLVELKDDSGSLQLRFFHVFAGQQAALAVGTKIRVSGEVRKGFFGAEMIHPKYRKAREGMPLPDHLTPIYPTTAGLAQNSLSKLIHQALDSLPLDDTLPAALLGKLKLQPFDSSLRTLHHPPPGAPLKQLAERSHPAWQRLKFDELLAQQLSLKRAHIRRRAHAAPSLSGTGRLLAAFRAALPFSLTGAQERVVSEISRDLTQSHPMQRLLQGDVGSGKTIVAAFAALQAIESGYQAVIMAPTEILAEQHYLKLSAWLEPLGIKVAWLAASVKSKARAAALETLKDGSCQLAVGTHALFQQPVEFARLGLAVVDEQHRFGVAQRLALRDKGNGLVPHQLMMSATPIPRTLSMSYFADLDVSIIDELPPGRSPIATKVVGSSRRDEVIDRLHEACRNGTQAYWVCPIIGESDNEQSEVTAQANMSRANVKRSGRSQKLELQAALSTHEELTERMSDLKIGLVHGRMKAEEKAAVMNAFKAGELHLLVATTVIEVGVDVPNASLMIIEHAERMGLSQLHQLRGRVGRGSKQSSCLLLYQAPLGDIARQRLKAIQESQDGFEIARFDLELRGPGEFLGARQSGQPMLRFADIEHDQKLLQQASQTADWLLQHDEQAVEAHLQRWLGSKADFATV